MYCGKCGSILKEKSNYCAKCGSKIPKLESSFEDNSSKINSLEIINDKNNRLALYVTTLVLIIALAIIMIVSFYTSNII